MHGAVYGVLFVGAVLAAVFGAPLLIIPIAAVGLLVFAVPLIASRFRGGRVVSGPGPGGVPSTGQASYDPTRPSGR
jgi:hypothetical protein